MSFYEVFKHKSQIKMDFSKFDPGVKNLDFLGISPLLNIRIDQTFL